jgi:hypothetical protein
MLSFRALKELKQDIRRVSDVYDVIKEEWNKGSVNGRNTTYPIMVVVSVLLHNMAFDSSYAKDYNHEDELEDFFSKLNVLKEVNEYNNKCYITHFAYSEVAMLVQAWEHMDTEE